MAKTYEHHLRAAAAKLKQGGIDSADSDARLLLMKASGLSRAGLIMQANDEAPPRVQDAYFALIKRRLAYEPIAHIIGTQEFWALAFEVTGDVLIPRPETEGVVEKGLALLEGRKEPRILDVGTGSGAILISLLSELPAARGIGIDISEGALKIAARNAQRNGVDKRCTWVNSDFLDSVEGTFDLVVSNPPYIDELAMERLPDDVKNFEPHLALSGGADGLAAYRKIIKGLLRVLKPGGHVVFEIGFDQGESVPALLAAAGLKDIIIHKDLAGHDRTVSAKMC